MRVFLVRHAIGHERDARRWPQDSLRPLTPSGEQRFRKAARGLATLLPRGAVLLTSPFVRARRTADLLQETGMLAAPLDCAQLSADEPVERAFELLRARHEKEVIIVGHEPNLGRLLGAALAGEHGRFDLEFKKGGAACIEFRGRAAPGRATLIWMLPPRVLRQLR